MDENPLFGPAASSLRIDELAESATALRSTVTALADLADRTAHRARRNRRSIHIIVASLVLDVVLTTLLGLFGVALTSTTRCLTQVTERIKALEAADSIERAGQRRLLQFSLDPLTTREQRVDVTRAYVAILTETDAQRAAVSLSEKGC